MTSLRELLDAHRLGRLTDDQLVAAAAGRPGLTETLRQADRESIVAWRADGTLAPELANRLLQRLAPASSPAAPPADADRTVVRPTAAPPPAGRAAPTPPAAAPGGDDRTVVRPAASAPPSPAPAAPDDDATRVNPVARPDDDATRVNPVARPAAPADDDATRVSPKKAPADALPADDPELTRVQPPARESDPAPDSITGTLPGSTTVTGSTTGSTSSTSNTSTWQRVAADTDVVEIGVGTLLKGRFYLEQEVGRGGMGVVFKSRDERKVEARDRDPYLAVKVLNDEFRRHPESLIALQRESRRSQQLAHDNIVRVFDFDKDGSTVFMTMEYIDGSDLKGLIREKAFNGMPLAQARGLIDGMARGLARAHADGVVHSDFKPGNVMVTRAGVPKVFDFGIARASKMGEATGEQTVFDAGQLGALTPAYASLEMIDGQEPQPADDVYALGCVVYELLTGRHPFDKIAADVAQREGRRPPLVKGLTQRQQKALTAAVAFRREHRLKTTLELIEGLRELSLRERAVPYLLVGVPAAAVLIGGAWGVISYRHSSQVDELLQRFAVDNPQRYASEDEARAALEGLDEDERQKLLIARSDLFQNYLLARIDGYWQPDQGRLDYPGAQKVFALRDRLKLYSPTLDERRAAVELQRNQQLNALDTQLSAQIGADAIFETTPDNAVATLTRIRAIDPGSSLLKNAQLELKYDAAIGRSLDESQVDLARQQLASASKFFAGSARLTQRGAQLEELAKTLAAQRQQQLDADRVQRERAQALQTLVGLLDHPVNAADWRSQAAGAYRAAAKLLGNDEAMARQAARLREALVAQTAEKQTAGDLTAAIDIAGFGIDLFPGDPPLAQKRQALLEQQNRIAQEAQSQAQRIDASKARVTALLAQPLGTAVWLQDLDSALDDARKLVGANAVDYTTLRQKAAAALLKLGQDRIAAGDLDGAERIAKAGGQGFAGEARFDKLAADVDAARSAARNEADRVIAQNATKARQQLAALAARPEFNADWQRAVSATLDSLKGDTSGDTRKSIAQVADAIALQAAAVANPQQIPQAKLAIEFGLKFSPQSTRLAEQRTRLDALARDSQAKADQDAADAEVKSRIESVRSAVAANDIAKARESLARIRALQPANPFLKAEGPDLLAGAYLHLADEGFQKRSWQDAADLLAQGLKFLGDRADLRNTRLVYDAVATLMKAGDRPLAEADYERVKKQLDDARKADAGQLARIETDLKARKQLAERTLAERLERLKPVAPTAATPTPPSAATTTTTPAPATATAPATAAPATTTPAPAAAGADPCAKPELVGKGKVCGDSFGDKRGPRLVVVPGVGGGAAYALSRGEVTITEFNDFCVAAGKCAARVVADADLANAAVSDLSLAQAQAYAAWASTVSGHTYRLPTDAEWMHAAKAGGFSQAEDSNCIPPGASTGLGAAVSAKGRSANGYGLVNLSGNVWEWTVTGSAVTVHGASYAEYWSDCTVDAKRSDAGKAASDVGFRILREIK